MVQTEDTFQEVVAESKSRPLLIDVLVRLVREKPLGTLGGVIVLVLLLTGVLADVLAPCGYNEIFPDDTLQKPSTTHLLGTDNLGRDLLSRVIYGARISVIVGLAASALSVAVAVILGVTTGYTGGKYDLTMQRFVDAWMSFPYLVIVISIMSLLGPGMFQVITVLGITSGIRNSRVVRSATISIKENTYVEAARVIGCKNTTIITRHILPNIVAPIIIIFTIAVGHMILQESTLSFLGFGIPAPVPSWGSMLSGTGRQLLIRAPWVVIWPGLALSIVVYGINMLGDGVRDVLDPRLRGGLGRYSGVKLKKIKEK